MPLLSGLLYLAATKASPEGCRLVEMFTRSGVTGGVRVTSDGGAPLEGPREKNIKIFAGRFPRN